MDDDPKSLATKIQMLATLVATATYAAAFNPPGGVWQDIHDTTEDHRPGDPIMRSTHFFRYPVFFYGNAVAFTLSLIVVVLTLFVGTGTGTDPRGTSTRRGKEIKWCLGILMALAMVAFTLAYGAGACRTKLAMVFYCVQVPFPFFFIMYQANRWRLQHGSDKAAAGATIGVPGGSSSIDIRREGEGEGEETNASGESLEEEREKFQALQRLMVLQSEAEQKYFRALKRLMVPLSMFALTITYAAGLSTPGGFWDSAEGGHRPGDAILGDHSEGETLSRFLTFNTAAFLASLFALSLLTMDVKQLRIRIMFPLFCLYLLVGLVGAYVVGNSRGRVEYWYWPLYGEVFACMLLYVAVHVAFMRTAGDKVSQVWSGLTDAVSTGLRRLCGNPDATTSTTDDSRRDHGAHLVQLMAGLAVAITYQAGLYPPGGLWPANADGHTAGDPILLATNARRYRGFHYCNSVSFVASLLAILLAQKKILNEHHALEAAMLLDMLGLVGAYAIGSCRDQVSTLYAAGLAGAGVVYVFVHVSYFTLGDTDRDQGAARSDEDGVENMGGRFLLFAVLVASITYQAGLTPPGGFLLKDDPQSGHRAGDPVLLYNSRRRYGAFFYCNSVSFMLSIVVIVLLVNPNQYRVAVRSHAVTVCSAVSYACLMVAFAAGSTQHLTPSYTVIGLAVLATVASGILFIRYWDKGRMRSQSHDESPREQKQSEYLMTLAILVASAAYPAGLDPPGGSWQSSSDGHDAGNPVMRDSRRHRYLAFLVGNTASFMASVMLILVLLFAMLLHESHSHGHDHRTCRFCLGKRWVNAGFVPLQCLGFLVAYAAGSSREWKTSAHIGTLVSAVLLFVAIHVCLSYWRKMKTASGGENRTAVPDTTNNAQELRVVGDTDVAEIEHVL